MHQISWSEVAGKALPNEKGKLQVGPNWGDGGDWNSHPDHAMSWLSMLVAPKCSKVQGSLQIARLKAHLLMDFHGRS